MADLFKIDEIEAAVKTAIEKMGGLDILVNNGACVTISASNSQLE